jgi:hypothetical protein
MAKETTITEAGAAIRTIEFVGIQNLISTFSTFDAAIHKLEHQRFPSRTSKTTNPLSVICHPATALEC